MIICIAVIGFLTIMAQQILAHATKAQLSYHPQNVVAITRLELVRKLNIMSIKIELS